MSLTFFWLFRLPSIPRAPAFSFWTLSRRFCTIFLDDLLLDMHCILVAAFSRLSCCGFIFFFLPPAPALGAAAGVEGGGLDAAAFAFASAAAAACLAFASAAALALASFSA